MNPNIKLCLSFQRFAREGANPRLIHTPFGLPWLSFITPVSPASFGPAGIFSPEREPYIIHIIYRLLHIL